MCKGAKELSFAEIQVAREMGFVAEQKKIVF